MKRKKLPKIHPIVWVGLTIAAILIINSKKTDASRLQLINA